MSDPCFLAVSLLAGLPAVPPPDTPEVPVTPSSRSDYAARSTVRVKPKIPVAPPEFDPVSPPVPVLSGPASGPQLFAQRVAALRSGQLYTRLASRSFASEWIDASRQPTYEEWQQLLAAEARAVSAGRGSNRLSVVLGDSISLWFPHANLPGDRLWLNQGISGDTTGGILQRLSVVTQTQPDTVYLMAGINDLKRGFSDEEILGNLREIVYRFRQESPHTQVFLQSILPTRSPDFSNDRIRYLNRELEAIAREEGAVFLDLHAWFGDERGDMRADFTTDGVHLTAAGYRTWRSVLVGNEGAIALR